MRRLAALAIVVAACRADAVPATSGSSSGDDVPATSSTTTPDATTSSTTTVDTTTGGDDTTRGDTGSSSTGDDAPTVPTDEADNLDGYEDADLWSLPSDNYFVCGTLAKSSAPLRYADFDPISARGDYSIGDALDSAECGPGRVRFDLHEILQTTRGRLLFHKGGQGYDDTSTPYGHLWIADLESPAPSPQVSGQPPEYGAPSKIPGTDEWSWDERNGRGCDPSGDFDYVVHIVPQGDVDELPPSWQYKPNATSSRFNKYADAGAEQAEGTAHHAYLMWSWLHRGDGITTGPGGGQVRALVEHGQPFLRCAVDSIDSIAYASGSADEVGRVTAIYGKTRSSEDGPWIYGWAIHSHRARRDDGSYGPRIYHVRDCSDC